MLNFFHLLFVCWIALRFAEQGRKVILIEREEEMGDRIVGELMQPGGFECMKRMGMGDVLVDERVNSVDVKGYTVVFPPSERDGSETVLSYPLKRPNSMLTHFGFFNDVPEEGDGRDVIGKSFHHHRVVNILREKCRNSSNISFILVDNL